MPLDKIIVIITGLSLMGFTYWFFLMKREKEVVANGDVDITVEGGYTPEIITIPFGQTTRINFLRKDPSTCLEEVVLSDFKIKKFLPLNEKISLQITPKQKGEFDYSCAMGMYHGKIIVR